MATPDELDNYIANLLGERKRVADVMARYASSTGNRTALMAMQRAAQQRQSTIDKYVQQAQQMKRDAVKTAKPAAAAEKPLTAEQQLKEQHAQAQGEDAGKLAKSKEEQLKALEAETASTVGLGGPGIVSALKTNPGVANYTPGVAPSSTVDGQTLYSTPGTVTLQVPKTKDEDFIAAEKQRLLDRKALEARVQGTFQSMTQKPVTAELVLSKPLKFAQDGTLLPGQGVIAPGLTQTDYNDMREELQRTQPPSPEDRDKFRSVTIPAPAYEAALGKYNSIVGPENAVPSAVQKEIVAHQIVDSPAPALDIAAPELALRGRGVPGLRLGGTSGVPSAAEGAVPGLNPGEAPIGLRAATAGKPIAELNRLDLMPPLAADPLTEAANARQAQYNTEADAAGLGDLPKRTLPAEDYFRHLQNSALAEELGFKTRPDQVGSILAQSATPLVSGTGVIKATGQPLTLDLLKQKDYPTYERLLAASADNTKGELDPRVAQGAGNLAMDLVDPRLGYNLAKFAADKYGPLLTDAKTDTVPADVPVPLQDQLMLP